MGSNMYMCGMQPLVEGCPCHDIFQCDPELLCCVPVEADFYASRRLLMAAEGFIRDINLCAICAGKSNDAEGGKIDPNLKMVYICKCASYLRHMQESRAQDISRSLHQ